MSYQVGLSTVIDDNKNIINVVNADISGIITASSFSGSGDDLLFSPSPTSFSPIDGGTGVSALSSPDVSITYNQGIILGVGTITLRKDSPTGTIAESYEVGVSTRVSVSGQTLTISPEGVAGDGNFDYDTDYYVVTPQGAVTNYDSDTPGLALTSYNFTTEAGPVATGFNPGIGSTNIDTDTNIVLTFDKNIRAGVGTITLEVGTGGTSITESYDVQSSGRLTFSTNTLTIDPTSDLSLNTNYYVVVPDDAVAGYTGISTYEFTTEDTLLGTAYEGGYLICQASSVQWIVAPSSTEVTRVWGSRNDAVTTAQANASCGDWFVPTCGQLQNPGYTCVTYWDSTSPSIYFSSTEADAPRAWAVSLVNGVAFNSNKGVAVAIRAFRCVSY